MWDDLDKWCYWTYKYRELFQYFSGCSNGINPPVPPTPEINVFPYGGFVTLTNDFSQDSPEWDLLHLD